MIQLSIIVVTWNCRPFVTPFFESFGGFLEDPSIQFLVIDNNSGDGTAEMIRQRFPTVHLTRNSANLGFAKATNMGLAQATGQLIALINPDVQILPGCLERMMEWMREHKDIGLLGPQMREPDGLVHRSTMRFPTAWNYFCDALALDSLFPKTKFFRSYLTNDFQHDETREVEVLNGWFWMTRQEALEEVGALDQTFFMYGEDIDWCKRFGKAGWKRVYLAGAAAVHYGGGSSSNAPVRFYVEQHRAVLQYFRKHYGIWSQTGFLAGLWIYHLARIVGHTARRLLSKSGKDESGFKIKRSIACIRWLIGFAPETKF